MFGTCDIRCKTRVTYTVNIPTSDARLKVLVLTENSRHSLAYFGTQLESVTIKYIYKEETANARSLTAGS